MPEFAPVAVFAYSRPDHTRRTLEALARASGAAQTRVTVYLDGPRSDAGRKKTEEVRRVAQCFAKDFGDFELHERPANLGLSGNITDGVSRQLSTADRLIVVEDDIVVAPGFLEYMNWGLARLANDPRVGSIHGYCYPSVSLPDELFFLKGADCWGWATWADRWALFEADGRSLLRRLLSQGKFLEFTMAGAAPYGRMLCRQILGKNDSWAVRWHASLFLEGRLTLYPTQSLVRNIGLDGSGENCGMDSEYDAPLSGQGLQPENRLPAIAESVAARKQFARRLSGGRSAIASRLRAALGLLVDSWWLAMTWLRT